MGALVQMVGHGRTCEHMVTDVETGADGRVIAAHPPPLSSRLPVMSICVWRSGFRVHPLDSARICGLWFMLRDVETHMLTDVET